MLAMVFYLWIINILLASGIFSKEEVIKCIKLTIWINVIAFLIQFSIFELTGYFIDFNNYIREEYANTLSTSRALEFFIIGLRTTGFYSEPSFYAMSIFPASIIIALYERRIGKTFLLSIFTSMLSLSIAAIVIVLLSLLAYIKEIRKNKLVVFFLIVILIVSLPYLYDFIMDRLFNHTDYDAVGSREMIFAEFDVRGVYNNILGSGYFNNENKPIGVLGLSGAKIRDSSFYIYTFFSSGVLGCVILAISFILFSPSGIRIKYAILILFLFKFGVLTSALWFFLMTLFVIKYPAKNEV